MWLTTQILKEKGACAQGLEYFNKHYKNGVDTIDILKNNKVPLDILHWGYLHLNSTEEEKQLYYDRAQIINSSNVNESTNIINSEYISKSYKVSDSRFIFNSNNIENSRQIYDSENIELSEFVNKSAGISNSQIVLLSNNIDNCINIYSSNFLSDVNSSRYCNNCYDSAFIEYCDSITNSYFSLFCKESNNLIFCFGLQNKSDGYYVFNKLVSKNTFELAKRQILRIIKTMGWKLLEKPWSETAISFDNNPTILHKDLLTNEEIDLINKIVKTFIGYDEQIFKLIVG